MLKVHEVFKSFQGEGVDIGMPMVFVRFVGCNLACKWCDTLYASRPNSEYREYFALPLIEEIEKFENTRGVTLTGGEPMVQDTLELDTLIYELKGKGHFINIETNGIFLPVLTNDKLVDRFSISPKLSSSKNKNSPNLDTLSKYLNDYPHKIFFKFVISNEEELLEMFAVLESLKQKDINILNIPIVVQPNIDPKKAENFVAQQDAFKDILKEILFKHAYLSRQYNIRVIPQFHKYLWANKKGV
jgi:7-cyano-7-deazaguanosine (preQ0) biosynthesis protein QueE